MTNEANAVTSLPVEHLCSVSLDIGSHDFIKDGPQGSKVIAMIAGGTVTGKRLTGKVVENSGGDWVTIGPKGEMRLDVRFLVRTDDDALIYVTYTGLLNDGRALSAPLFETDDERYRWLNSVQGIGVGSAGADGVNYEFYTLV